MEDMTNVLEILSSIQEDNTVPNNVRTKVQNTISCLKNDDDSVEVSVDKAIQCLDELSNDSNIPMFTRTQIWSAISALESK
jgi:uncharacterized protein (UPF0147 family)